MDTGSVFTWIDKQASKELGVEPKSQGRKFKTIEGREILRDIGDQQATRIVVFAEKGDTPVLGLDSLEGLGFEVDPVSKSVKKVVAFAAC